MGVLEAIRGASARILGHLGGVLGHHRGSGEPLGGVVGGVLEAACGFLGLFGGSWELVIRRLHGIIRVSKNTVKQQYKTK